MKVKKKVMLSSYIYKDIFAPVNGKQLTCIREVGNVRCGCAAQ